MPFLFRAPQPKCQEPGCKRHGTWVIRSEMMRPDDAVDLAPRCGRHARMLAEWYDVQEQAVRDTLTLRGIPR